MCVVYIWSGIRHGFLSHKLLSLVASAPMLLRLFKELLLLLLLLLFIPILNIIHRCVHVFIYITVFYTRKTNFSLFYTGLSMYLLECSSYKHLHQSGFFSDNPQQV